MKLFLDDIRRSPMDETWVTVQSYEDMILILATCWDDIDEVSLDHDLGTQRTGFDVLNYIEATARIKNNLPFAIYIHSMNFAVNDKMAKVALALKERFNPEPTENQ